MALGFEWETERPAVFRIGCEREALGHGVLLVWSCDFFLILFTPSSEKDRSFILSSLLFLFSFSLSRPIQLWAITTEKILYHLRHNYKVNVRNSSLVSMANVSRFVISKPFLVLPWKRSSFKEAFGFSSSICLAITAQPMHIRERTEATLFVSLEDI